MVTGSEDPGMSERGSEKENDRQAPLEQQRELMKLLSQETRHAVLQTVLGHPAHLASQAEIQHMVPDKSPKAVTDQIERLVEGRILAEYVETGNESIRDLPATFYGPTGYGIRVLDDFHYLQGVPMARAIYSKTRKTERIETHREAPRPELPPTVKEALGLTEDSKRDDQPDEPVVADATAERAATFAHSLHSPAATPDCQYPIGSPEEEADDA